MENYFSNLVLSKITSSHMSVHMLELDQDTMSWTGLGTGAQREAWHHKDKRSRWKEAVDKPGMA